MSDTAPIEHPTWLTSGDFTQADEPLRLWQAWFEEAAKAEPRDPNAMSLATVDPTDARCPHGFAEGPMTADRILHQYREEGGGTAANPKAALYSMKSLNRQIRIRGDVERVTPEDADAYFATRPKGAQIGAWASQQSRPLESRLAFEKAVALYAAKYALGTVPRPPHWSGYRIVPISMEFWHDRPFRLHDRIEFRRAALGAPWSKVRMYP